MNKRQFIEDVAAALRRHPDAGVYIRAVGSSTEAAEVAVEVVIDRLMRNVLLGHKVAITGFASLSTKEVAARAARNPHTGEPVVVPARRKVEIKPHVAFQAMANGDEPIPADRPLGTKAPKGTRTQPKKGEEGE